MKARRAAACSALLGSARSRQAAGGPQCRPMEGEGGDGAGIGAPRSPGKPSAGHKLSAQLSKRLAAKHNENAT